MNSDVGQNDWEMYLLLSESGMIVTTNLLWTEKDKSRCEYYCIYSELNWCKIINDASPKYSIQPEKREGIINLLQAYVSLTQVLLALALRFAHLL